MPRIPFLALCAALLAAPAAFAQSYPQKPIRYIVPFPAGGIADVFARIIGGRLSESWGHPVVVKTRAGARATTGADFLAKAPPAEVRADIAARPGAVFH